MTHIGPQTNTKRPHAIDEQWNYVFGDLICTHCGGLIATSTIEYPDRTTEYVHRAIAIHICPIPFAYDFDSPLTIREQLQAYRDAHAQPERKGRTIGG